jgi:hypothetical protein
MAGAAWAGVFAGSRTLNVRVTGGIEVGPGVGVAGVTRRSGVGVGGLGKRLQAVRLMSKRIKARFQE